ERRARAVQMRRTLDFKSADEIGKLDPQAIETVRQQAWPEVESPDELHDALMLAGFLGEQEQPEWESHFQALAAGGRAASLATPAGPVLWIAAERKPQFDRIYPGANYSPVITAPPREQTQTWTGERAPVEIVRGRLETLGPVTA